jgi:glucokinase
MTGSLAVGVDIGGTKMLAVALDGRGEVVASGKVPTPPDAQRLLADLVQLVQDVAGAEVASLGVGVPGMVDRTGVLRRSPHLPALEDVALGKEISSRLGDVAVRVANDATCAGWAEHIRGAALGVDDVVMVTLGTGIGGGIVERGRLVEGAHGYAGEIGHMVVDPHGPRCPCGRRGCWERFASGSGLGRLGREWAIAGRAPAVVALAGGDPEAVRGEHVTVAATAGDGPARDLMAELAWWLVLGLGNLTDLLDPAMVVIGGGLIRAGEVLMEPTRRAFAEMVEGYDARTGLVLRAAALGETAGAIGAALLGST